MSGDDIIRASSSAGLESPERNLERNLPAGNQFPAGNTVGERCCAGSIVRNHGSHSVGDRFPAGNLIQKRDPHAKMHKRVSLSKRKARKLTAAYSRCALSSAPSSGERYAGAMSNTVWAPCFPSAARRATARA